MGLPHLSTLLLRPAVDDEWPSVVRLLPRAHKRPGQQALALCDVTAEHGQQVRGVALVRKAATRWFVVAAAVDTRWPPAGRALVEQLRAAAISAGASTMVFAATCADDVLAAVVTDSATIVDVGGAAVMGL